MLQLTLLLALLGPQYAQAGDDTVIQLTINASCKESLDLVTSANPWAIKHLLEKNVEFSKDEPIHLLRQALTSYSLKLEDQLNEKTRDRGPLRPTPISSNRNRRQKWYELAGKVNEARQIKDGVLVVRLNPQILLPPTSNYFADSIRYWVGSPGDFIQLPESTLDSLDPTNILVISLKQKESELIRMAHFQEQMRLVARGYPIKLYHSTDATLASQIVDQWQELIHEKLVDVEVARSKLERLEKNMPGISIPPDVYQRLNGETQAILGQLWRDGSQEGHFFEVAGGTQNIGTPYKNTSQFLGRIIAIIHSDVGGANRAIQRLLNYTSVRSRQEVLEELKTDTQTLRKVWDGLEELKNRVEKAKRYFLE